MWQYAVWRRIIQGKRTVRISRGGGEGGAQRAETQSWGHRNSTVECFLVHRVALWRHGWRLRRRRNTSRTEINDLAGSPLNSWLSMSVLEGISAIVISTVTSGRGSRALQPLLCPRVASLWQMRECLAFRADVHSRGNPRRREVREGHD